MVSPEEATRGLRQVDKARGQVWAAYLGGWTLYAGAALLVGLGLVEDLAPGWAGLYFFVVGLLCLVVGLLRHTRRGRVMLRVPAAPRSAWLGTGHRGTRRSQALLAGVWVAAIVLFVLGFGGTFSDRQGGNGGPADHSVPSTVWYAALALALIGIDLAVRRWAQGKIAGHARG